MTVEEFRGCVGNGQPPAGLGLALAALWWDAKGNWKRAHESAQQDRGPAGAWVHAYLHRKEGDLANADYWYGQAGKTRCQNPPEQEWSEIAQVLLQQNS